MSKNMNSLLSLKLTNSPVTSITKEDSKKKKADDGFNYLSDNAWHIVKCGGASFEMGCGKRFSLAEAGFRGSYLVCPHCGMEN